MFEKLEGVNNKYIENAVRNLTINVTSVWASSTGAVGVLAGIIQDFNLYNITIEAESVIMVGRNAVGGLAGMICGEFDIDQIHTNIGANSTRASTLTNYSVYMSKSNKKDERYNLNKVYYAGSVAGILDGYDGHYNINSKRDIDRNYNKVRNISVDGVITLTGDTVGGAFGFVGEQVYVQNIDVNISGSVFGTQYSAGAIGENRGVLNNAKIVLADELFKRSPNVSSGAVGLNLGGLVMSVDVTANIIKTGHAQMVAGIVGRNVYGVVSNAHFDGELFGYFTGGIVGANYDAETLMKATTGSGAISYECKTNSYLVPSNEVEYYQNETRINNFSYLSLSRNTLTYLIENSNKYYTYKNDENNEELMKITVKSKVLGLVVGLSYEKYANNNEPIFTVENIIAKTDKNDTTTTDTIDDTYNIHLDSDKIVFNSDTIQGVTYKDKVDNVELLKIDEENSVVYNFANVNVLTMSTGKNYVMYLVGAKATSFDSWASYTSVYLLVQ